MRSFQEHARDSKLFPHSLSLSKNIRTAHKTRKERRRISDITGIRPESAARPVGRASEALFKDGFTLFLEVLFGPGGTDLAVAGVIIGVPFARESTQRNDDDGRERE